MHELIESIRAAVAQGATAEQKAIGAQACRTILTALEAEPGKPIVLPGASAPNPLSRLSLDQVLDLLIARLSTVANAGDPQAVQQAPAPPRGLRIPMAATAAPSGARVSGSSPSKANQRR